jgi:hypothetical protein
MAVGRGIERRDSVGGGRSRLSLDHAFGVSCEIGVSPRVNARRRRWVRILAAALAAVAIVAVPSVREPLLRAAGWVLVVNEPVAPRGDYCRIG